MKIKDLADYEVKSAILDKKRNVICPNCKKRLAQVTEYGLIRNCQKCGEKEPQSHWNYGDAKFNK